MDRVAIIVDKSLNNGEVANVAAILMGQLAVNYLPVYSNECIIDKSGFQLDEPYAVIKGEPLSLLAYGKTAMRHVGDIDILISRDNMGNLLKCLDMDGFEPSKVTREEQISAILCSHQILPFTKRLPGYGDVTVDINFDIFWGEYEGKRVDINSFLSDALYKEIYGVAIKTLPPLKNMVQLVLHHYKDMNSIFCFLRVK